MSTIAPTVAESSSPLTLFSSMAGGVPDIRSMYNRVQEILAVELTDDTFEDILEMSLNPQEYLVSKGAVSMDERRSPQLFNKINAAFIKAKPYMKKGFFYV